MGMVGSVMLMATKWARRLGAVGLATPHPAPHRLPNGPRGGGAIQKATKAAKLVIYPEVLITFSSWNLELERYGS